MSAGDRQLAAVRARQQERQHMAYRLRKDAHPSAGHPDQPHVRMGGGQPRGRLPDRHQQPSGHIHRDERRDHVSRHAHRSHGPVRSRLTTVDPRWYPDTSGDPLTGVIRLHRPTQLSSKSRYPPRRQCVITIIRLARNIRKKSILK